MKKLGYKIGVALASIAPVVGVVAHAEDLDVTTALSTGFTSAQTQMLGVLNVAIPAALVIVAAVMAVRFGIKFFKGMAK